jgi:hypothetical protein
MTCDKCGAPTEILGYVTIKVLDDQEELVQFTWCAGCARRHGLEILPEFPPADPPETNVDDDQAADADPGEDSDAGGSWDDL